MTQVGPVGQAMELLLQWLLSHGQPLFALIQAGVQGLSDGLEAALNAPPAWLLALALSLLGLNLVLFMGLWPAMLDTLALVVSAALLALLIGLPIGVLAAQQKLLRALIRPLLDLMQTMPAFVYLIPAVMFFSTGQVPAVIATLIFAMPPVVRLTVLGLRQVPADLLEAGSSFGCTRWQLLWKVQLPSALPTLMAGINQTIMLSLSMVVIASMIGGGGLGDVVLRAIQQLNLGMGFEGGLAVVILAVILDRLTQSLANPPALSPAQRWGEWLRLWRA